MDHEKLDEQIILIDQFRNMLFLEGILQNNQCFISLAYDLDIFITQKNFDAFEECKERISNIIKSENLQCGAFHVDPNYSFFDKLKWFNHFMELRKEKGVKAWSTPEIKEEKS